MAPVGPQGIWIWGGCSASACARSSCSGLRAAETFPSEAGCDTCGPLYLYQSVQPADGGLHFALCFAWGGTRGGCMSHAAKSHVCGCHSITLGSHQYPSLAGHGHAVGARQPTAVGSALGQYLSPSGGVGRPLRPPAPPVRASLSPPRGGSTRECVSLMRLGLEQLCCWQRERGMERGR